MSDTKRPGLVAVLLRKAETAKLVWVTPETADDLWRLGRLVFGPPFRGEGGVIQD